jgi:hypothetical protein
MANSNNSVSLNSLLSSKKGGVKTNTAGFDMPTGQFEATLTGLTQDVYLANGVKHEYLRVHFKVEDKSYDCSFKRLYFTVAVRNAVTKALQAGKSVTCTMKYIEIERYGRRDWGYDCA